REGLPPGRSLGICLIPAKFYQDRNTVMLIVSAKHSDVGGKRTFNWRKEICAICIHPINAPKSRSLVKQAKRSTLVEIARLGSQMVNISESAKDELVCSGRLKLLPGLATN